MPLSWSTSWKRVWYQMFHSSNEMSILLSLPRTAPTWSAVATTASMNRSVSTEDARNESMSPSCSW